MSGRVKQNLDAPLKPPNHSAVCRECGHVLTARKPIARKMCRSCWRVYKLLAGAT